MSKKYKFELTEKQLNNLSEFLNRVSLSGINEASAYIELLDIFNIISISQPLSNNVENSNN